jgi:hypothetical protein
VLIQTWSGNEQLEQIKTHGKLRLVVAFDHQIAALPFLGPGCRIGLQCGRPIHDAAQAGDGHLQRIGSIASGGNGSKFVHAQRLAGLSRHF